MGDTNGSMPGVRALQELPPAAPGSPEKADLPFFQPLSRSSVPGSSNLGAGSAAHPSMRMQQLKAQASSPGEMPRMFSALPLSRMPQQQPQQQAQQHPIGQALDDLHQSLRPGLATTSAAHAPGRLQVAHGKTFIASAMLAPAFTETAAAPPPSRATIPSKTTILERDTPPTPPSRRATLLSKTTILAPSNFARPSITSRRETVYRSAVQSGHQQAELLMPVTEGYGSPFQAASHTASTEDAPQVAWQVPPSQTGAPPQTRAGEVKRLRTLMQQSRAVLASRWGAPAVSRMLAAEEKPLAAAGSAREPVEVKAHASPSESPAAKKEEAASRRLSTESKIIPHAEAPPSIPSHVAAVAAAPAGAAAVAPAAGAGGQGKKAGEVTKLFAHVKEAPGVAAWRKPVTPGKAMDAAGKGATPFIPKIVKQKFPLAKPRLLKRAPLPSVGMTAVRKNIVEEEAEEKTQQELEGDIDEEERVGSSLPFSLSSFPSHASGDSELNLTATDFLERLPASVSVRSLSPTSVDKHPYPMKTYRKPGEISPADEVLNQMFESRMFAEGVEPVVGGVGGVTPGRSSRVAESFEFPAAESEEYERQPSAAAADEEEEKGKEEEVEEREEEVERGGEESEEEEEMRVVSGKHEAWATWGIESPGALTASRRRETRDEMKTEKETEEDIVFTRKEREEKEKKRQEAAHQRDAAIARRALRRAERQALVAAAAAEEEEAEKTEKKKPSRMPPHAKAESKKEMVGEAMRVKDRRKGRREVLVLDKRVDDLAAQEDYERAALVSLLSVYKQQEDISSPYGYKYNSM